MSKSGLCWFKRYIVKTWVPDEKGEYKETNPRVVLEDVEKDWYVSRTKKFGNIKFKTYTGTVIKTIEGGRNTIHYYIITEKGIEELKYESIKVTVIETLKVRAWYYKNIVYLPDGQVIEDIYHKIYTIPFLGDYTLSEVEKLKEVIGNGESIHS